VPGFEVGRLREVIVAFHRRIDQVADEVMLLAIVDGGQDPDLGGAHREEGCWPDPVEGRRALG